MKDEKMEVEIKELIKELGKENEEVEREIKRLKKEFKSKEMKWEKDKNNSNTAGKENGKWRKEKKKK
jgi:hypothetical protein